MLNQRVVGGRHLKMTVRPRDGAASLDAIAFNQASSGVTAGDTLAMVYRLDVNEYRGVTAVQLMVEHIRRPGPG